MRFPNTLRQLQKDIEPISTTTCSKTHLAYKRSRRNAYVTAGIKTSTAVTGRNQEQILVEGFLQKDSSKPSAEEKRHGVSHTNKCKKNKINLLEGRKKASLETLLPFWPPSKTWAYRTHFVEQRYVRWEAG